jgi:hypothetical protein
MDISRLMVVWPLVLVSAAVTASDGCWTEEPRRINPTQGPHLGALAVDTRALHHPVARTVRPRRGRLVASPATADNLVGLVVRTGAAELAIRSEEPDDADPDLVRYEIAIRDPDGTWRNPCSPSGRGRERALPVSGVWDSTGAHHDSEHQFTFACEDGAIAKCISWGYKPWAFRNGRSLAGLHQACTRAARADYCGTGEPNTVAGTVIGLEDVAGVLAPVPGSRFVDEATWGADGAVCVNRTRLGGPLDAIARRCPGRFTVSGTPCGGSPGALTSPPWLLLSQIAP